MNELTPDEREALGERLMLTLTCNHGSDYFGPGAVCETCWANIQRIGRIVERALAEQREQIAQAIEASAPTPGDAYTREPLAHTRNALLSAARIARGDA